MSVQQHGRIGAKKHLPASETLVSFRRGRDVLKIRSTTKSRGFGPPEAQPNRHFVAKCSAGSRYTFVAGSLGRKEDHLRCAMLAPR
jgi:hypothetical protein